MLASTVLPCLTRPSLELITAHGKPLGRRPPGVVAAGKDGKNGKHKDNLTNLLKHYFKGKRQPTVSALHYQQHRDDDDAVLRKEICEIYVRELKKIIASGSSEVASYPVRCFDLLLSL